MRPFPFVLGLFILLSSGCASLQDASNASPSVDVNGTWLGSWSLGSGIGGGPFELRLQQTGSTVRGEVTVPGFAANSGPLEGSVADNELSYRLLSGGGGGELTVAGNEMRGYSTATGSKLFLRRQP